MWLINFSYIEYRKRHLTAGFNCQPADLSFISYKFMVTNDGGYNFYVVYFMFFER